MLNSIVIIWTISLLVSGFLLMFTLKKLDRKLSKYDMIFRMIFILLACGFSFLAYGLPPKDSDSIIGWSRLAVIALSTINIIVIYYQPWTKRDTIDFAEDSFLTEFMYMLTMSFICSIAFIAAPYYFELVSYSEDLALLSWDLPLVYLIPFVVFKILDFSGQIPLKSVENPWLFPIEKINPQDWKWRNLLQVNFILKSSLLEEYNLFTWSSRPWIEAPKEVTLGSVFQLCIQERRAKSSLASIQDMGDEYDGEPKFCWLFYLKPLWHKPSTWFRTKRHLNPFISIEKNNLSKGDIIVVKRIVGDGSSNLSSFYTEDVEDNSEKTVLINR